MVNFHYPELGCSLLPMPAVAIADTESQSFVAYPFFIFFTNTLWFPLQLPPSGRSAKYIFKRLAGTPQMPFRELLHPKHLTFISSPNLLNFDLPRLFHSDMCALRNN
ncbi:hypothetical protein SPOG_03508 [Schizosaccharomyces cryophilus OY26]|uniref:Uncharacterized protein n=1 Tax=Schizosaccharomyces cryophilus (strain OY26 / ATCC MYA-4695 / CBS 11777 / NBRC 106824 / NRRL Y48691) TaxID=653667 RepID=S9VV16_SCHCR|nr:uncharacterized protein SPOG_03508 [Schizosaccharomyces cryophilus OY26]EPY50039.1 hypothetical protein SPOG_03508 [Schizosaccharomyces cryophilus OY26]